MIYTAIRYSKHSAPPLSILGDALASFLKRPDVHTQGMDIISNRDIQADCSVAWKRPAPREWRPPRQRWASAASRRRWYSGLIVWVALTAEPVIYTEQAPQKRTGLLRVRCLPALRYPHAPHRKSPDMIEVAMSSRFRHC